MRHSFKQLLLAAFLLATVGLVAQPTISGLSGATSASRSGRVLVQGSGFRAAQGSGHVTVNGVVAPITRWSDSLIAAYVPEAAVIGADSVQVVTATGGVSNTFPLQVTSRSGPAGRVRWRFQADGDYIMARPAVGRDGTVYTVDVSGHVYALARNGGLKWVFNLTGSGFGNVDVGPDGSIYLGSTSAVYALRPNGTLRWKFTQSPGAFIFLGPNVGPDGNIYGVGTQGMGVFSLDPTGKLRWSVREDYDRPIVILQEIVFAPSPQSQLYFHANRHLRSLALDGSEIFSNSIGLSTIEGDPQPAVGTDGTLYSNSFSAFGTGLALQAFDNSGNSQWSFFGQLSNSTNILSTPTTGPDGVVYDGRNLLELYALNPDGTMKWVYTDPGILFAPAVSPTNDLIFTGGIVTYGKPGFFAAISTAGVFLWRVTLPTEGGAFIVPMSKVRFAPDGSTAYVGTSHPGQSEVDPYSYLYSVRTKP